MSSRPKRVCFQFMDSGHCTYGTNCKYSHSTTSNTPPKKPAKKKSKQPRRGRKPRNSDAISEFFAQYPEFDYTVDGGVVEEFYRMCDFFNWDRDDDERKQAHRNFKDAMVVRFNHLYGTDVSNIENWQKLCIAVNIVPLPMTIAGCKAEMKEVHVNLVDLVDTSGRDIELFPSLGELREYTVGTGKYFPKESAYAGGVLKFLLREIFER